MVNHGGLDSTLDEQKSSYFPDRPIFVPDELSQGDLGGPYMIFALNQATRSAAINFQSFVNEV